jgi:hypothetical protein
VTCYYPWLFLKPRKCHSLKLWECHVDLLILFTPSWSSSCFCFRVILVENEIRYFIPWQFTFKSRIVLQYRPEKEAPIRSKKKKNKNQKKSKCHPGVITRNQDIVFYFSSIWGSSKFRPTSNKHLSTGGFSGVWVGVISHLNEFSCPLQLLFLVSKALSQYQDRP